ncbi:monovalent cation:proton antiporter-2 (CPA2) family protein [Sphingobium boeckii]|uniref:Monovalent cation:proton antiporter-2 (CPA2) family protein n=1 Tax=Sphingobium boeckii TaxID=1082345 RepID=A0A7W9EGC1_9SPHN|nr:monovalent cation:proton antiporter-2 (CPA2) family protein [Sphingobium boeckii]MBB5686960.1 monovalent cation:proton antiporter-2 (CPA2) family protein [Sphingobium boeckii]
METEVHATTILLQEGVVLLGAALLAVMLFRKLGLGAVLGYLVAGVIIGPQMLGLVGGGESKLNIAEIGIVLLLFIVGLELNLERLWRLKREIFGFGLAQVVVSGIAITLLVFTTSGFTIGAALALGLPLALSSTAQVLPGLKSSGRINTPFGERAFSILLFQDLSIVPLITIIAALSRAPADPTPIPGAALWASTIGMVPANGVLLAINTVAAIVGLVLAGRYILRPLLSLVGRLGERELFIVVGLFTVFASAALMETLHLSTALGAFVAGVMLADSPYRHEIEADVEPFRSILLGLFFLAVGMVLDVGAVLANPLYVIGMAAALVALKTGVIFGIAKLAGMKTRQAFGLGLLLSQGGEFGFVLFGQAQSALLIEPQAASLFGAIVTLSMATTPFLLAIARRFESAESVAQGEAEDAANAGGARAIVIGYGRFGQTVSQLLISQGVSVTIIDQSPSQIELSSTFGMKVYYGDGRRVDLLRGAGGEEARLIIFCTDDRAMGEETIAPIQAAFPRAQMLLRAYDRRQLIAFSRLHVAGAVREVYESALTMGAQALAELGLDEEDIRVAEREFRERDMARFEKQAEAGDLHAAQDMMFRPGVPVKRGECG